MYDGQREKDEHLSHRARRNNRPIAARSWADSALYRPDRDAKPVHHKSARPGAINCGLLPLPRPVSPATSENPAGSARARCGRFFPGAAGLLQMEERDGPPEQRDLAPPSAFAATEATYRDCPGSAQGCRCDLVRPPAPPYSEGIARWVPALG